MSRLRPLLLIALFLAAVGGTLEFGRRTLDAWNVRSPAVGLNLVPQLLTGLDEIRTGREGTTERHVAFFGDSISISMPGGTTVPHALRRALGAGFEVHSLAALGTGPFDYYFLADRIAEAEPDLVVIAFSLQSFGDFFRSLSRERLSGWVAPRRLLQVAIAPTHWIGLTADDLLMNALIVSVSGGEVWRQLVVEQARLGAARAELAAWLGETFGRNGPRWFALTQAASTRRRTHVPEADRDRYNAASERRHYGAALDRLDADHPALRVLADTVRTLGEAGIPVLVYMNPVNVEHLHAVGVLDDGRLHQTLATVERVIHAAGADYLDLHDLLGDAAFRDAAGHLGPPADPEGPAQIAEAVAVRIKTGSR